PKPEPVPPPKEWKIKKPWRPEQLSKLVSFLNPLSLKHPILTSQLPYRVCNLLDVLLSDSVVSTRIYSYSATETLIRSMITHSCWKHPPFQKSSDRGGKGSCMFHCGPHRQRLARDRRKLSLGRICPVL